MKDLGRIGVGLLVLTVWSAASAHEVRPALLDLTETAETTYQVTWKRPARSGAPLKLTPVFPVDCREVSGTTLRKPAVVVQHRLIRCDGTLSGRTLAIEGLESTLIDVLVRVELASGDVQSQLLRAGRASFVVARKPSTGEVATSYLGLGVEHILLGIDHLLFVFGLLLLASNFWLLLKIVTAFTLGHSISLALATLGVLDVPPKPLEAAIALSIVFLAAELVRARRGHSSLTIRKPWLMSFGFGLIHGVGFAGALVDYGLPRAAIPIALLFFNLGVEIGQLLFVVVAIAVLAGLRKMLPRVPHWIESLPAYAIGTIAGFWFCGRLVAIF